MPSGFGTRWVTDVSGPPRAEDPAYEQQRKQDRQREQRRSQPQHGQRADHQDQQRQREGEDLDREGREADDDRAGPAREVECGRGFMVFVHTPETRRTAHL
jgi:hypothetical protein